MSYSAVTLQASRAARDYVHVMFFACCTNPYNQQAQSMSTVGVGSAEMNAVLTEQGQLPGLRLILNGLKTQLGYVILLRSLGLLCFEVPCQEQRGL
jgi:hypothetical protein